MGQPVAPRPRLVSAAPGAVTGLNNTQRIAAPRAAARSGAAVLVEANLFSRLVRVVKVSCLLLVLLHMWSGASGRRHCAAMW